MALLVLASDIIKLPVAAIDLSARVGKVRDVFVDTDTGDFIGVTVTVDWLGKPKFVTAQDIVAIEPRGLIVKTSSHLVEIEEIVKVKKIYEKRFRLIGLSVITQSGRRLGKVTDLVISTQTNKVVRIYVGSWLQDRIIPWHKIVKIDRKAVVVEDDVEEVKVAVGVALEQS